MVLNCTGGYQVCVNGEYWSACSSNEHTVCIGSVCQCISGTGTDLCTSNDQCLNNNPPTALNLRSVAGSYCTGIQGSGLAYFQWNYSDPDNDNEKQFELQIDDNSNFSSPEVDRLFVIYGNINSGDLQQQLIQVKTIPTTPLGDYIKYSTPYYWRVKVQDQRGADSGWIVYSGSYTFEYSHPAPSPGFAFTPANPQPAENVAFTDNLSVCYNNSGLVSCRALTNCIGGKCYTWNFGDSSPLNYTMGNVSHTYGAAGTYPVSLRICDDISCCYAVNNVIVGTPSGGKGVPQWKEISPF